MRIQGWPLPSLTDVPHYVLMVVETLGDAFAAGWRTRPSEPCLNVFVDGRSRASSSFPLCWLKPASERAARPSGGEYHAFVCTNASLSPDIFTTAPQSAKLSSFVPQLILKPITQGPVRNDGPFCLGCAPAREVRVRRLTAVQRSAPTASLRQQR